MELICGNCEYSVVKVESEEKGRNITKLSCHFNPPSMEGWPPVEDGDWCGKFEAFK